MTKKFLAVFFACCAGIAQADIRYDSATQTLFVPSVEVDGVRYNFLQLKITAAEVVGFASHSQAPAALPRKCNPYTQTTQRNLAKIQNGMTLDQVNQIIGCQYKPPVQELEEACNGCGPYSHRSYIWGDIPYISVDFDKTTGLSVRQSGVMLNP
ncbi:hypothetical protein MASR1M59_14320 [Melaminivora sp.]